MASKNNISLPVKKLSSFFNVQYENTPKTVKITIADKTYTVARQSIMENSTLIKSILEDDYSANSIKLPSIVQNGWTKEFSYFIKFLNYKYVEIPEPLPEKGAHFTKENCGSDDNVNFINNFYDKTIVSRKGFPIELIKSTIMADHLGATNFLNWSCAKSASVMIELGYAPTYSYENND